MSSSETNAPSDTLRKSLSDEHIRALRGELSGELEKWVGGYTPLMRAKRVPNLVLTMAATAPFLSARELMPAACLSMWLFAVDDLFDESVPRPGDVSLWSRLERSVSVLEGSLQDTGGDPLLEAMRDIRDQLRALDEANGAALLVQLRPRMARALRELMEAMRLEEQWSASYRDSGRSALPSLSDYLEKAGLHSIGVLPVFLCLLGALRDGSIAGHQTWLLEELGWKAARCVRLANDLRSYERELAEGKPNSVGILQRESIDKEGLTAEVALDEARKAVLRELKTEHDRCVALCESPRTQSGLPERYIKTLVSFVWAFYERHDYHHPVAG